MTTRREFLISSGAGLCVVASPLAALAQQTRIRRIGILSARARPTLSSPDPYLDAFTRGMRELGYVEGKNLVIESRYADGKYERLPALGAELLQMKVEVFVTNTTPSTEALQRITKTIPIVMATVNDPVGSGFVKSLSRPGGNITGLSLLVTDLSPKYLELLRTMLPKLSRLAVLVNPGTSSHVAVLNSMRAAANKLTVSVVAVEAGTPGDFDRGFAVMKQERAGALIIASDSFFNAQRQRLAELALKNRIPSMSALLEYVEAGGLMSYGQNIADFNHRAATYVDKILKGASPADLPIEQPMNFELVVNGKTAKALGLTIPQSLLISANKVIE